MRGVIDGYSGDQFFHLALKIQLCMVLCSVSQEADLQDLCPWAPLSSSFQLSLANGRPQQELRGKVGGS